MAFMVSMLAIVSLVSMVSMRFPWFSWFLWFWFLCLVFIMCVLVSWMCFKMILIRGVCVSKWSLSVCVSKWSLSGVSKWSGSRKPRWESVGTLSFRHVKTGGESIMSFPQRDRHGVVARCCEFQISWIAPTHSYHWWYLVRYYTLPCS